MELQDQIYVLAGVLGGVSLITIICILVLVYYVFHLLEKVKGNTLPDKKR